MLQSLLGGGGPEGGIGLCELYRETTKICVIRSEFSPMAIDTFTSRRKLNITVLKVYMYIKFIVTAKSVRSDFSSMAPDTFTFRRKKGFVVANRV